MFIPHFCSPNIDPSKRRLSILNRRLEMLRLFRDSLESRLAAMDAAITTLEAQIHRIDKSENEMN